MVLCGEHSQLSGDTEQKRFKTTEKRKLELEAQTVAVGCSSWADAVGIRLQGGGNVCRSSEPFAERVCACVRGLSC